MPTVKTTTLLGSGNIAADRITINKNFEILQGSLNNMQTYLDVDNKALQNLYSASIMKGGSETTAISENLIRTNGSISALGNATIGGLITGNLGKFANGLEVTKGNITLPSSSTQFNLSGDLNLGGELVLGDFYLDGYVPAYQQQYFQLSASSGENLLLLSGATVIGGKVSPKGRNAIVLDWTSFDALTPTNALYEVLLMTNTQAGLALKIGHVIDIVALIPDGTEYPFYLLSDTLRYPGGFPEGSLGVRFTDSYQSVRVVYDGSNWIILNLEGATIAAV